MSRGQIVRGYEWAVGSEETNHSCDGLTSSSIASADLLGTALIVDGDNITISGNKIRLNGIDTPEKDQTGKGAGITWRCGY